MRGRGQMLEGSAKALVAFTKVFIHGAIVNVGELVVIPVREEEMINNSDIFRSGGSNPLKC